MTMGEEAQLILIVEDDESTRRVLGSLFRRRGWRVITAASLSEGVYLLDEDPDWVFLDLMLPDGDGENLLRVMRVHDLPSQVVVTTAVSDPARLAKVHDLQPDFMLQKPIDWDVVCRLCEAPLS
jgi:DNA-binding response OmpR family regulator